MFERNKIVSRQTSFQLNHITTSFIKSKTINTNRLYPISYFELTLQLCQLFGWYSWWKIKLIWCIRVDVLLVFIDLLRTAVVVKNSWFMLNIVGRLVVGVRMNLKQRICNYSEDLRPRSFIRLGSTMLKCSPTFVGPQVQTSDQKLNI